MKNQEKSITDNETRQTLWVVTELYYPEETSTGYYLTRIAEGLTDDFEVKVLCGQPNYSARGTKAAKRENHQKVEIFRAGGTTLDKNIIVFRLINMLTLSLSVFFKAVRYFRKGDKILVVTTPPSLPFITAFSCLLKGASYILLIHDNYPEILIAAKKSKENSFFVNILNYFNRWLYKYANKIIVCGRDMFELVKKKTEGLDIPIETIQNWAELENVRPFPRAENELLKELQIEDQLVFLYAGNMGYPNDLESIIECAFKLKDDERFCFVFLGAGVKRKWLEREIAEKSLKNIKLLDSRPRSEQNIFLNACDVAVVTLVKKMWGVSMPSRTYNILAAGKPILALTEKDSEIAKVVEEDLVGWTVPPNEPAELLQKIFEIYESKEKFAEMGKNARRSALEKYSLETALKKYKTALK
ncbi:MAG TPA: glycosyltransferase family 4 protein [Pyrinomonadaceae bacterium]|nr:glycosyltransferase family 4 protein [Pyrinomonadaceae bacterium]